MPCCIPALAPAPAALREYQVFAVGAQSVAAARRAGYTDGARRGRRCRGACRGHCARIASRGMGPILYPSGARRRAISRERSRGRDFTVDRVVLYDAVPAESLAPETIAALKQGTADGVLLYSPRSARIWAMLASRAGIWPMRQPASTISACRQMSRRRWVLALSRRLRQDLMNQAYWRCLIAVCDTC